MKKVYYIFTYQVFCILVKVQVLIIHMYPTCSTTTGTFYYSFYLRRSNFIIFCYKLMPQVPVTRCKVKVGCLFKKKYFFLYGFELLSNTLRITSILAMTNLLRTCPPNSRDYTGQQCSYSTHLLPIGSHSKQFNRVQCVGRFHQLAGMINGLRH